jgi:hypothetical protein
MLSNIEVTLQIDDATPALCTLCGLMCESVVHTSRCERRNRWQQAPSAPRRGSLPSELTARLSKVRLDSDTLIWLDACDVQTARAAIQLAQHLAATIHVGQSTGSHATKKVVASDGWLGTTLSEISARADLVITLGDSVLREAPLLAERFFHAQTQPEQLSWVHITQHANGVWPLSKIGPQEVVHWPRELWFDLLSELALQLVNPSHRLEPADGSPIALLSHRLLTANQTVWIWDIDELHFQTDELIVRRMLSIAKALTDQKRCGLLPLDLNIGRVTAEETLLWLTGCPGTATWNGSNWFRSSRYVDYSLEQWSASFSSIVMVSNLASDRSLPNLPAKISLHTAQANQEHEFQVAAVGRDCSGHLFRGDRGAVLFAEAVTSSGLPTAAELLTQLMENAVDN